MIIFRKNTPSFHSIENVFKTLLPYLKISVSELPFESKGLINRLKNIWFIYKFNASFIHISGNDHYLLWFPFKNSILTIHDLESLKRKNEPKRWIFKKLWFDIPMKNAVLITTISEFSKNEILSLGNYNTPIKVIYNPLTLPLAYSPQKFNDKETRILHLGTKKNKNLSRTIKALQGVECHLTIVGKLNSELLNLLKLNLINYTIKYNLSNEQIVEEYKKCDLVSFVSTYEGFGLPIIEAQALGRAVITSNVSSMPEVAGDGALLVNPFSTVEIKEGFLKLKNDKTFRENLITKGLENVKRFEPSLIAKQYTDAYKSISNEA